MRRHRSVFTLFASGLLALCCGIGAQGPWEVGTLEGAAFRLKVPSAWNRALVIVAGGYSPSPITFRPDQHAGRFAEHILQQRYAYAETGYSAGGVAIAEGVKDILVLRRHFIERYGRPERTFLVGESKGGLVALVLLESSPAEFDGALAISGLLSTPYAFFSSAFDILVRFQKDFPGVLPPPALIPATYRASEEAVSEVLKQLDANEERAADLRASVGARRNHELAELLAFHTEALGDVRRRCGGNAFRAHTTSRPPAPTETAGRSAALTDAGAERCVKQLPGPTGKLRRPLLALDTARDPVIPSRFADEYLQLLSRGDNQAWFVREVVMTEGHLTVSTADRLRAFASLVRWVAEGDIARPQRPVK